MVRSKRTGKDYSVQANYDNQDYEVYDSTETFQDLKNNNMLVTSGSMSMNNRQNTRVDEVRAYTLVGPFKPIRRTFGEPVGTLKTDW